MEQPCTQSEDAHIDRWGRVCSTVMRNPAISPAAKAVYSALTTYADRDGYACVSHDRLASELSRSRSWVCGAFSELANAGVVEISHRFAAGRQLPSTYRIRDGQTGKTSRRTSPDSGRTNGGETGSKPDGGEPSDGGVSGGDPGPNAGIAPADTNQDKDFYISLSVGHGRENSFDKLMGQGREARADHAPDPESGPGGDSSRQVDPLPASGSSRPTSGSDGMVPADWQPTPDDIAWARGRVPGLDTERFTESFVLSCRAKGYRYTDVSSAWRRWLAEPKGRLPLLNQSSQDIRRDRTSDHAPDSTSDSIGRQPGSGQRRAASSADARAELNRRNDAKAADCMERILARRAGAGCAGAPV